MDWTDELHARFRASRSTWPVQRRNFSSSRRSVQKNLITLFAVSVSARWPEYVSTRQRRNSLRHGANRWPRVAFHKKRSAANKENPLG